MADQDWEVISEPSPDNAQKSDDGDWEVIGGHPSTEVSPLSPPIRLTGEQQAIVDQDNPFAASNSWMANRGQEPSFGGMIKESVDEGIQAPLVAFNDKFPRAAKFTEDLVENFTPSGMLNIPTKIENIARGFAGAEPAQLPFAPDRPFVKIPEPTGTGALAGFGKLAAQNINALQTPEMLVEAPLFATPLGRLLFGEQMGAHLPDTVEQSATNLGEKLNPTAADYVTNIGQPIVEAGMTAALAKGHTGKVKPRYEEIPFAGDTLNMTKGATPKAKSAEAPTKIQTPAEVAAELGLKHDITEGGLSQFSVTTPEGKSIPFAVKEGTPKADIAARAKLVADEMGGNAVSPAVERAKAAVAVEPSQFKETNNLSKEVGLGVKSVADLQALSETIKSIQPELDAIKKKVGAETDPKKRMQLLGEQGAIAQKKKLLSEAIEIATNSGGWKEGATTKLGDRPLDFVSNPAVDKWLGENAKALGIEFTPAAFRLQEAINKRPAIPVSEKGIGAELIELEKLKAEGKITPDQEALLQQRMAESKSKQGNKEAMMAELAALKAKKGANEKAQTTQETVLEPTGMGAAAAGEVVPSPKTPTSIKNETVDAERQQRGLSPAIQPVRRAFGKVWDDAMARIDRDPGSVDRLVNELRDNPRALTDLEDATILHRQIDLQNEYGKATRDLAQAYDDGRMDAVPEEQARVQALSDQLLDLYNIGKKVGTETGRGLNARKMMAYEDFSLAKMELEKRAANEGRPLTDKERSELNAAHEKINSTQKKLDDYVSETTDKVGEQESVKAVGDIIAEGKKSKEPSKPADIEAQKQKIKLRIDEGERSDITGMVQKLARMFVEQGIRVRDPLIDAVHGVLKEIDPEFTRRETMDAISGYGDFKQLTKDEISVKVRDLKGQMQQVAKLEDMQANKPPLKTGIERRIPSTEESRLIRLVNEAKNQFQIPIDDPNTQLKSSLDTLKTRLKNQISQWEDRLQRGDFTKKPKRVIQMDAEANKLHFENAQAKSKWHEALMKDRLARRSVSQKIFSGIGETLNTIRAVMTSFDLSAVLRQGGFIAFAHPFRAAKSFPSMFKAMASEAGQHAVDREIVSRKSYPLMTQSKLYLSEHGQKLSQMEEAYMSRWADKIPGVAASQRAYTTFLNKLRADSFDAMYGTLTRRAGEATPEQLNSISNYINVATGRGNLGMKENALVGLNTVFFAPRYVASRIQLAIGQPLWRGDIHTRRLVAEEYARFLTGLGVVYALGQTSGADVETDPRSADFGKMRFGNTRVDPLAGLAQVTTLIGRLSSGETKRLNGDIVPIRGPEVPYGAGNSADVMARFLRTKLAPVPGAIVNVLTGKDVVGQPVTAASTAKDLTVPMSFDDIYKAMVEQGVPAGTAMGILSTFGMSLQTYEDKK